MLQSEGDGRQILGAVRMTATDERYPHVALLTHLLGAALNPGCHFDLANEHMARYRDGYALPAVDALRAELWRAVNGGGDG